MWQPLHYGHYVGTKGVKLCGLRSELWLLLAGRQTGLSCGKSPLTHNTITHSHSHNSHLTLHTTQVSHTTLPAQHITKQTKSHGIMGSPEPNYISQVRPSLDCKYTSLTTPGLQICVIGCRVAVPRSHWSAVCLLHLPVVEGLIFCISATPHLGTSFPLFHAINK